MVASQQAKVPLVADVKIFEPERSKNKFYIQSGIRQVYLYTQDYNVPVGYLVIFTPYSLETIDARFILANGIQVWQFNGKSVFFVQIDIFPHEQSASHRPAPEIETITAQELIASCN